MKNLSFLALFASALTASAVTISPILEGKQAAFSFTYDDGAYSHYTTALPMHLKYGMPATFFIITDRVEQEGEEARRAFRHARAELADGMERDRAFARGA